MKTKINKKEYIKNYAPSNLKRNIIATSLGGYFCAVLAAVVSFILHEPSGYVDAAIYLVVSIGISFFYSTICGGVFFIYAVFVYAVNLYLSHSYSSIPLSLIFSTTALIQLIKATVMYKRFLKTGETGEQKKANDFPFEIEPMGGSQVEEEKKGEQLHEYSVKKSSAVTADNPIIWKDRKHVLWFPWTFTKYEMDDDRLYVKKGLFRTEWDETLLYRITDIRLTRNFDQKLCGTGTIELCTTADHNKHIFLHNIKRPLEIKRMLSEKVEEDREEKDIVGREFYGSNAEMLPHGPMGGRH